MPAYRHLLHSAPNQDSFDKSYQKDCYVEEGYTDIEWTSSVSSMSFGLEEIDAELLRLCDLYNVPVATNIATAEVIITALDRGDLDWREIYNPRSAYNRANKKQPAPFLFDD